ncbi:uncharacterized protein LOC125475034 [Pyrus x bretschneideri]|uniref:uncharacterized protein LOC125475034 n=1 Tax=Pyrus x bretschneideri TaxID=225117 RepID=UPI00202DE011|nr:uncharacterized protein LOC125475034 [Pyrus x bretschneideri]
MNVIDKITPSSGSAKHAWILVATHYFTKWVEAKLYSELTFKEVCNFVDENIVTRFDVLEMIITENDAIFTTDKFREYTASVKIWLVQSTLYYPQENGHAEAMRQELEDLEEARLDAYNILVVQKKIVEGAYNRRVSQKTFGEEELVWQTVLPIRIKDPGFGKWS